MVEDAGMNVDSERQTKPKSESKVERAPGEKKASTKSAKKEEAEDEDGGKDDVADHVDITKPKIAQRTVCISGISEDVAYKQLLRKIKKFGRIEALMYPAAEGTDVAYVQYHGADQAANSLHKLVDGFSIGTKPTTVQMFNSARVNRFRVIVRNLPFKCTEEILREHFATFGDILQLDLPLKRGEDTIRGFGFVTYTNAQSANKAVIEGSKIKILGRQVAVDLTVGRDQVIKKQRMDEPTMDVDEDKDANEPEEEEKTKEKKSSKKEKMQKDEKEDEEDEKEESEELDPDDPNAWPTEVPEFESESEDDDDEDVDSDDEEAMNKKAAAADEKRAFSTDVHLGQTLFLRNVAFDTTEDELYDKFSEWGTIKHAKIVKDRQTGEAKGTAFVHFVDTADAERCLKDAYQSQKFNLHTRKPKIGRNNDPSIESDIQVGGRRLIIATAVSRKSADKLTEENKEKREKFGSRGDRRNLGLAALSTLGTDDMAALTKEEREKYERGQHEKNQKLANPNFHVSRTRLCIRNLPKNLTEDQLRAIFSKASEDIPGRAGFHQVKIVRDKERDNASRGYGFVEFSDHIHAKTALQVLNGKHNKIAKGNRLFVEFAVEDSRVLQAREFRLQRAKEQGLQKKIDSQNGEGEEAPKKSSKDKKRKRDSNDAEGSATEKRGNDRAQNGGKRGTQKQDSKKSFDRPTKKPKLSDLASHKRPRIPDPRRKKEEEINAIAQSGDAGFKKRDGSRRGVQTRKSEAALEKMIGQYKQSLESDGKKRWFE